jgi:membrane protein DedA with SNARE-associated domain
MNELLHFLTRHGYAVLFGCVAAEQLGLPIPAVPVLLAMGALAARGHFDFGASLAVAAVAAASSDTVWYALGQWRGHGVVRVLCKISLEPDSCVRRTTSALGRYGARSLLFAKFVPGLSTAAPPMAGLAGVGLGRFLVLDLAGGLLWAGAFLGAGALFHTQLEKAAGWALRLGSWLLVLLAAALAAYVGRRYYERRRFLRQVRVARITPDELKQRLDAGEEIAIIDLRHALELAADPATLPGAIRLEPGELSARHHEIPRDRDIVVYCS